MTTRTYLDQFPNYDDIPAMSNWRGQSVWLDTSYHNDVCPSFESDNLINGFTVKVHSDYKAKDKREPETHRYIMSLLSKHGEYIHTLLMTNDIDDITKLVSDIETAKQP